MKRMLILISVFMFSCVSQHEVSKVHINPLKLRTSNATQGAQVVLNRETEKKENVQVDISDVPDVQIKTEKAEKQTFLEAHQELSYRFPKKFVKISVENMPVKDFIVLVFGKILKTNYYLDNSIEKVKGEITLKMQEKLSLDSFFSFVKQVLSGYGVSVEYADGVFKVSKAGVISGRLAGRGGVTRQKAIKSVVVFGRKIPEDIPPSQMVTQIVPLYYINANQYGIIFRKMALSPTAKLETLADGNAIVATDTVSGIAMLLELVDIFDKPAFAGRQVKLLHLEYASPAEFVRTVEGVFKSLGIPVGKKPKDNGVILNPIDSISSVLVVSPKEEWLEQLIFWKKKLDTPDSVGSERRLFIYRPKNRSAQELVSIMKSFSGEIKGDKKTKSPGKFKVVLDKERNSVIIYASPKEFSQIKQLLESIDTLPKQVLIEVTIAEVTLKDSLQYGVEWYLRHSGRFRGELQTLGGLGVGGGGFVYSVVSSTQKFQAVLNAFAQKNLINILSTPRLVVLDNHDASINVGTQVPVITSETTSADVQSGSEPSILRNVEYRTTGVTLNVKPIVHSNGILTLDIRQEVSEAQTNNVSNIDSPIILNRSIKTSVVLKNGQTAVLGGLISENRSKNVSKVPLFGDIPVLGNAFKTNSVSDSKTELIVMITPYIISNAEQMDEVVRELRADFGNGE